MDKKLSRRPHKAENVSANLTSAIKDKFCNTFWNNLLNCIYLCLENWEAIGENCEGNCLLRELVMGIINLHEGGFKLHS